MVTASAAPPSQPPLSALLAKGVLNAFTLAFALTLAFLFTIGSYDFLYNVEQNKCDMTWMFNNPEFIRINLELDKTQPNYGLYAYAEGSSALNAANLNKFNGIPVLFIPGNAGSYKQVRSLASISFQKSFSSSQKFDYFTLSFNSEHSALYPSTLSPQAIYTQAAIKTIQGFYDAYHSVVIVGHSMGGLIAKTTEQSLIFTLATPHSRPVLMLDPEIDLFYHSIKNQSSESFIVSITGGDRDILVPDKYTKVNQTNSIQVTTTSIPAVWASTDHLCIVWCKQLALTIVRSLFDLVVYENGYSAVTQDKEIIRKVIDYHFIKRSSGKSYHTAHPNPTLPTPEKASWNEVLTKSFCQGSTKETTFLMFPMLILKEEVNSDPNDYSIVVLTSNTKPKSWIFGCTSQSVTNNFRFCSKTLDLSRSGELIPHIKRRRKVAHLNYTLSSHFSHIVIRMDPSPQKTCVYLSTHKTAVQKFNQSIISTNKLFYNLTFPSTSTFSKLFAWKLSAVTRDCPGEHNGLASFTNGPFTLFKFLQNESLPIRFTEFTPTPSYISLYLDPTCTYNITTSISGLETAGQLFRTYSTLIPSFIASITLLSIYFQDDPTEFKSFHRILLTEGYSLSVIPGFAISILLALVPTDWPRMMTGEYFVILPIFLYLLAYVILLFISSALWLIIIQTGNVYNSILNRFLTTRLAHWLGINPPELITDTVIDLTFTKFPILIAVGLVSLTLGTCGGLGLAVGLALYLLKIFRQYDEALGSLLRGKIDDVKESLSPINFQFTCSIFWLIITCLNLPSLIHWANNTKVDPPQQDTSLYICLIITPTISILWQSFCPKFHPTLWSLHRYIFYTMGIVIALFGTFRLYIISISLVFLLMTTAVTQMASSIVN